MIIRELLLLCSLLFFLPTYGQGKITRAPRIEHKQKYEISKPDGYINGHGYVDLGLPSGTKWATCNVGANEPWNYGNYYSWGEVSTKDKYEMTESVLSGVHIDQIIGNANYDAATKNWGADWGMPSASEISELFENCKIINLNSHNVKGILLIGLNGKNIFFPKDGYCDFGIAKPVSVGELFQLWTGMANYDYQGLEGYEADYYSSALRDAPNRKLDNSYCIKPSFRGWGMPIRPVVLQ